MKKYLQYIAEFHNNNPAGIYFVKNQLAKHLAKNRENQTEIEHILDFICSTNKKFKIGYKTIKEKADKWTKKLQAVKTNDEIEGEDYEVVLDFKDGFKFVKLLSKNAYNCEGKLMSHCVASYFGKNDEVFSLRDENNKPHCTISSNSQQIKGKGNGKINPKYIKYVVEFLEHKGIKVRDSEMKNLGYVNFEAYKDEIDEKYLFRGKYLFKDDLDKIKEKDNIKYWTLFGLVDISSNFKIKLNFDISLSIKNFLKTKEASTAVTNERRSTAVANEEESTAVANEERSTAVANGLRSIAVVNNNESTAVTNERRSIAVANSNESTAIANSWASIAVVNNNESTAIANGWVSTAVANSDESTAVANGEKSTAVANSWVSTAVANSNESTAIANSWASTAIANRWGSIAVVNNSPWSKAMGVLESAIFLVERDTDNKIINVFAGIVDGKKIKENTFYRLKDGKLQEYSKVYNS